MCGVQEMGIVLVLVLVWLIGLVTVEGGRRKEEGSFAVVVVVVVWYSVVCGVWYSVVWCVVWVRTKIRCDGLLLLLCSK